MEAKNKNLGNPGASPEDSKGNQDEVGDPGDLRTGDGQARRGTDRVGGESGAAHIPNTDTTEGVRKRR